MRDPADITQIEEQAREIVELRRKLAEARAELDRLRSGPPPVEADEGMAVTGGALVPRCRSR